MARDYTKIKAWQLADELALLVYRATKEFPNSDIPLGLALSRKKKVLCLKSEVYSL